MPKIPIRNIAKKIKAPEYSGSFMIRDISKMFSGKDMVQDLHRHDFYLLFVFEKGKGEHIIDFIPYSIDDRSVFFMRPGQVHQLKLNKTSKGFLIQFDRGFYSPNGISSINIFRKVSNKNHCELNSASFTKLTPIVNNIFEEYKDQQENFSEFIKSSLDLLFIELARQSKEPEKSEKASDGYAQTQLERFLEILQENFTTKKQVDDYAKMMHLSTYQMNAITKSTLGKNCSDLINDQIILEAKRELLATSTQVNQIADELGYEDVSYFIRFFRKNTGYTPEAFRKNFK